MIIIEYSGHHWKGMYNATEFSLLQKDMFIK